jgi:hypothetical protein
MVAKRAGTPTVDGLARYLTFAQRVFQAKARAGGAPFVLLGFTIWSKNQPQRACVLGVFITRSSLL